MARRSDSDVLTDTDSYQTADEEDQPGLDEADVDALQDATPHTSVPPKHADRDRHSDSSGGESESSSSSSADEDDRNIDDRLTAPQGELEKRRESYQFAVSKSGGLIPDDEDAVCDLDPEEFHHERSCDEDASSQSEDDDDVPCDLDPREFSHPSSVQPAVMLSSELDVTSTTVVEGGRAVSDDEKTRSEVSEEDPFTGPLEALNLSYENHPGEVCVTERHESIVEGNLLPTIIIHSPTEKTLATDRGECIMHRSAVRSILDFSRIPQQSPLSMAVGNVQMPTDHESGSFLSRDSSEDGEQVFTRHSDFGKDEEQLPIVEAVVCETTELIRAKLIEAAYAWEDPYTYYENYEANLSSSPEKMVNFSLEEIHFSLEDTVPLPDYASTSSSSDSSSEAEDDVADDSDMPVCRTDRSPTPDYNTLSPISEQDQEFRFDVDGPSKPELQTEVYKFTEEINTVDDIGDYRTNQPLSFERQGSQRFAKPSQHNVVTSEPVITELVDEDMTAEYQPRDVDTSNTLELMTCSAELVQQGRGSFSVPEQQYRTGMESVPVMLPAADKRASETNVLSTDQPTRIETLGRRKRTADRSVLMPYFSVVHYIHYTYIHCIPKLVTPLASITLNSVCS